MKKKFVLELTFENEEGKRRKIDIDNPKLGLTEEEIIPAMQKIIDFKNIQSLNMMIFKKSS